MHKNPSVASAFPPSFFVCSCEYYSSVVGASYNECVTLVPVARRECSWSGLWVLPEYVMAALTSQTSVQERCSCSILVTCVHASPAAVIIVIVSECVDSRVSTVSSKFSFIFFANCENRKAILRRFEKRDARG